MGNRLQKTDSSTGTTNSLYDAANRLTSMTGTGAGTVTSDADGNTLTDTSGRTNTWDSQNRLVGCISLCLPRFIRCRLHGSGQSDAPPKRTLSMLSHYPPAS